MQWGIYLLLEKLKLLAYRNLFKRVCVRSVSNWPRVTATKVSYASRYAVFTSDIALFPCGSLFFLHIVFLSPCLVPALLCSRSSLAFSGAAASSGGCHSQQQSHLSLSGVVSSHISCLLLGSVPALSWYALLNFLTSFVSQPQSWCALLFRSSPLFPHVN